MEFDIINRNKEEFLIYEKRNTLKKLLALSCGSNLLVNNANAFSSAFSSEKNTFNVGKSNIFHLEGTVHLNKSKLYESGVVFANSLIETLSGVVIFVLGDVAVHIRSGSVVKIVGTSSVKNILGLEIYKGAALAVWGNSSNRFVKTETLQANIQGGSATYQEVFHNENNKTYFCNCWGVSTISSKIKDINVARSESYYHQSFLALPEPFEGKFIHSSPAVNHSDEEVESLARVLNIKTSWELRGKGVFDGRGLLNQDNRFSHPADTIRY